jgi:hypothetical protein
MDYQTLLKPVEESAHALNKELIQWMIVPVVGLLGYEGYKVFQGSTSTIGATLIRIVLAIAMVGHIKDCNLGDWTNLITQGVTDLVQTVEKVGKGKSESAIMADYKQILNNPSMVDKSSEKEVKSPIGKWWLMFSDPKGAIAMQVYQSLMLWLGNWEMHLNWIMGLLQRFLLLMSLAASPIFVGLWMLTGTRSIGLRYLMSVAGLALWPLGRAFGNLVTVLIAQQGVNGSVTWMDAATFMFFVGGGWIVINALLWPVIIAVAVTTGGGHAGNWMIQSIVMPMTVITSGMNVGAAAATGGGAAAVASGARAVSAGVSPASRPTKSPEA